MHVQKGLELEKRKAPAYRRQAEDEPAGRLFFNLLDGLDSDLEPMAPGAGQIKKTGLLVGEPAVTQ
jgi:hypothetical protein